jgi:hypothetical protein
MTHIQNDTIISIGTNHLGCLSNLHSIIISSIDTNTPEMNSITATGNTEPTK